MDKTEKQNKEIESPMKIHLKKNPMMNQKKQNKLKKQDKEN